MRKSDTSKFPQWQGRPVVAAEHAHDLETEAALHEFKDRLPRAEAEERAHGTYRRDHHLTGAAHHLNGMKAAQASGHSEEAKKHGAMYALHMKALGHDPYAEPPPEIRTRAQDPGRDKLYRFKAHKADVFLLGKSEPQTTESKQEPKMADEKQTPEQKLQKFWAEKRAQEKTQEVLQTLYKAAKFAGQVLAKNENEQEGGDAPAEEPAPAPEMQPEPVIEPEPSPEPAPEPAREEAKPEAPWMPIPPDPFVKSEKLSDLKKKAREFFDSKYSNPAGFEYEK